MSSVVFPRLILIKAIRAGNKSVLFGVYSRTMRTVWIAISALAAAAAGRAQNIAGDWQGTLKVGATELRIELHFTQAGNGGFTGTMDSLDQGVKGLSLSSIELRESKLKFAIDALKGTYEGKLSADGNSIAGEGTQGQPLPLG